MTVDFTAAFFRPYINTVFRICPGDVLPLELHLVDIKERDQPLIESFTLIFKGPLDRVAHDNTYRIEHDELGAFDLFVGPFFTPTKKDAIYYQAVFSKLKVEEAV